MDLIHALLPVQQPTTATPPPAAAPRPAVHTAAPTHQLARTASVPGDLRQQINHTVQTHTRPPQPPSGFNLSHTLSQVVSSVEHAPSAFMQSVKKQLPSAVKKLQDGARTLVHTAQVEHARDEKALNRYHAAHADVSSLHPQDQRRVLDYLKLHDPQQYRQMRETLNPGSTGPSPEQLHALGFRDLDHYQAALTSAHRTLGQNRAVDAPLTGTMWHSVAGTDTADTHADLGELNPLQKKAFLLERQTKATSEQQERFRRQQASNVNQTQGHDNYQRGGFGTMLAQTTWSDFSGYVGGEVRGGKKCVSDMVTGLGQLVTDPVNTVTHVVQAGTHAVTHWNDTSSAIGTALNKQVQHAVRTGDMSQVAETTGYALTTAATLMAPASSGTMAQIARIPGIGKLAQLPAVTRLASSVTAVTSAAANPATYWAMQMGVPVSSLPMLAESAGIGLRAIPGMAALAKPLARVAPVAETPRPAVPAPAELEATLQQHMATLPNRCTLDVKVLQPLKDGRVPEWNELVDTTQNLAQRPDIPFRYIQKGCQARSHLMCQQLDAQGLSHGKIFAHSFGSEMVPRLSASNELDSVTWEWHTAPIVYGKGPGGTTAPWVIDPSMFPLSETPVPLTPRQWTERMGFAGDVEIVGPDQYYSPRHNYPLTPEQAMDMARRQCQENLEMQRQLQQQDIGGR